MKWNDAWLSNVECDDDGLLDRYYELDCYIGSGAWTTNHQSGTCVDDDGQTCNWNYFVKIISAQADATLSDGIGLLQMAQKLVQLFGEHLPLSSKWKMMNVQVIMVCCTKAQIPLELAVGSQE